MINPWGDYVPWFKRLTHRLITIMERYDITDQVLQQLGHYAERIAYLQSIGDLKSAEVLQSSAESMADYADSQDEWLVVTVED